MALDTQLSSAEQSEYLKRLASDLRHIPSVARDQAVVYASSLLARGLPVVLDASHLAFVAGVDPRVVAAVRQQPSAFYRTFVIRKRDGGSREIAAPTPQLRALQDWLHLYVLSHLKPHRACHGFVRGRSIATNAEIHLGQPLILKLDIKEFFGTVRRSSAYRAFRWLGYSRDVSDLMASVVCLRSRLPQGAPTSPMLANYAAYRLDVRISAYAARRGIRYSRYADDLTLSGPLVGDRRVRRTVEKIMRDEGFTPNEGKRRYVHAHERQRVTGLVVNERLNAPRERRRWLRQELYYLQRFGIEDHLAHRGVSKANYKEFLYGHVYALNLTNPSEAAQYLEELDSLKWPY